MILTHKKFERKDNGFTLVEVVTATTILALMISSLWVIVDRCVDSTANSRMKMQAFEVARENLETILTKKSVQEAVEYGTSDRYPGIEWETVVETFFEPINSQMWLRAVCTATYNDTNGEEQSVKLVHWLTGLTKDQLLAILMDKGENQEKLAPQLIKTMEDAAIYAGVSADTIQKWLDNGMLMSEDDEFIKTNLDLFKLYDGNPSDSEKQNLQIKSQEDLVRLRASQNKQDMQDEVDPTTGLTYGQLDQMNIQDIWELMKNIRNNGEK